MRLAVDLIAVNPGLKNLAHLPRSSTELNCQPPGVHLVDGQPMRLQPRGHGGHIRVRRPVKAAKLRRLEPLVIGGIARRVCCLDKITQRRLLRRRALQQQQHPSGGQGVFHRSLVDCGLRHS